MMCPLKFKKYTIMNKIYLFIAFLCLPLFSQAQYFQAYAEKQGNDLVFFLRPNPGGGNITTGWSDMEFFLRFPTGSAAFNYGSIVVNSTDFPGVVMPYNGNNAQGSETGYTNSWFGTSYLPTPTQTYNDGQPYEVFRVTIDVDPATIPFELVHNAFFFPTYLALASQTGSDLSSTGGANKFYGGAINCSCPSPNNNDVLTLSSALPVELSDFTARAVDNQDALLKWETASEVNTSHFEIERSIDGVNWEWIGEKAAVGNSLTPQIYSYMDANVNTRAKATSEIYYRLRMVDNDESDAYSGIRNVNFSNDIRVRVYPNPTTNYLTLDLSSDQFSAELYDLSGRQVLQSSNQKQLDVSGLPGGTYQLRITDEQHRRIESLTVVIISE